MICFYASTTTVKIFACYVSLVGVVELYCSRDTDAEKSCFEDSISAELQIHPLPVHPHSLKLLYPTLQIVKMHDPSLSQPSPFVLVQNPSHLFVIRSDSFGIFVKTVPVQPQLFNVAPDLL